MTSYDPISHAAWGDASKFGCDCNPYAMLDASMSAYRKDPSDENLSAIRYWRDRAYTFTELQSAKQARPEVH